MKMALSIFLFLIGFKLHALSVQVPEDCLKTEETPCLAHIKSFTDQAMDIGQYDVRTTADTIVKWNSFDGEVAVELIKGKFYLNRAKKTRPHPVHQAKENPVAEEKHDEHAEGGHSEGHGESSGHEKHAEKKSAKPEKVIAKDEKLRISGVLMNSLNVMVHKDEDVLKVFDLKNFTVSEFDLSHPKQEPILIKTHFADKTELVYFSAPFFKSKNKFLTFLKVVGKPFDQKLKVQASEQTKVLARALASAQQENKEAEEKKAAADAKLKKVREFFFYRTFYR